MPYEFDSLVTEATRYARFTMKNERFARSIMMALTDTGALQGDFLGGR